VICTGRCIGFGEAHDRRATKGRSWSSVSRFCVPCRSSWDSDPGYFTPDLLAHVVAPGAVADIIVYLVSDAAAPVGGAVVPAYGA
jgi:hypothetical protein